MPNRSLTRVALPIALVAGTTLALQVLITRLLAAQLYYHFGFLAISLALLGVGAGSILIYLRAKWFDTAHLQRLLARWCVVLAVLLVLVPIVLVRLRFGSGTHITASFTAALTAACLLSALPFTVAGIVIALAVKSSTQWLGRLYAFDLAGAAIGAIVVVPLMWIIAVPTLLVALGAIAALAALLAADAHRDRVVALGALGIGLVAIVLAASTHLYFMAPATSNLGPAVADRWDPLNRVVGYGASPGSPFALLFYDRVYAPVPVHRPGTPLPDWKVLHLGPQSIGYAMTDPRRVLIIGGGGGRDIDNALTSGAQRVDVIELNKDIVHVVDKDLGRWSGSPYTLPRVHTVTGDGRSTLAARSTKYDQIHIGFTDTLSANSAQAFGLTEANLYTVQAYQEYFDHLTPDGILNISRLRRLVGDEALRATVLSLTALRERGIKDPRRNVVVILGRDIFGELFGTVLTRLRPWTPAELARIKLLARKRGEGIAFAPGGPYQYEWAQLAAAPSVQSFCTHYRLDVCAPTDNKPFFFNMTRLGDVTAGTRPGYIYSVDPLLVLLITLGILSVLAVLAFALPLLAGIAARPPTGSLVFFAAIGLGFLVLEVVLIQRFVLFLGFPTYALSVVLFSLLLFTGLGAFISSRARDPKRTLLIALSIAIVLIIAAAFGLQPLLASLISASFVVRVVLTVVLLAPFGVTLGMAMPIGLRRLAELYPAGVPWAWGINGIASVLASALGVAVAVVAGFEAATLVAAACYLIALAHAAFGRWPAGVSAGEESGTSAAESVARQGSSSPPQPV